MQNKKSFKGWLYLLPTLILMGIFTYFPVVKTFIIAFQEGYNYIDGTFVQFGFANFTYIFNDSHWLGYLTNTLIIVFVSVPITILLSLLISVGLNSIKRLQKVYQTIFFLPYVTNSIAIGMVFAVMFDSKYGLINGIIRTFNENGGINWLGGPMANGAENSKFVSMIVLIVYITWSALPFKILILLSSLQSIDKQYYQAAQIDGTSKFRTFARITVPFLSPQIAYLTITSFIGAFKEYTSIVGIFGETANPVGKPVGYMGTVVYDIYDKISNPTQMGLAAAGALVLFGIILVFTAINLYVGKKKVYY